MMRSYGPQLICSFVLSACATPSSTTAPQSPVAAAPTLAAAPTAAPKASCEERIEALQTWLASAEFVPQITEGALVKLPADLAPWGHFPERQPIVTVAADAIQLGGHTIPTAGLPRAELARVVKSILWDEFKVNRDARFHSITFVVPPTASWEHVVAAADGVAKAGFALDVAFEVPRRFPLGLPTSPLGAKLEAAAADPVAIAKSTQDLFAECEPVISLFGELAGDPMVMHEKLVKGLPTALTRCSCAPSPEDARTWFWHVVLNADLPASVVVRFRIMPGGEHNGAAVRAGAKDPWQTVVARIIETAQPGTEDRPIRFEVLR